jgi:iron complex transport system substrate-binding protein
LARVSLDRRALLAATLAGMAGLRGARAAGSPRVVCLEWTAAELVLALGIIPLALSDVAGYREWVAAPALPASVLDLGSRGEPNKELVARLKPDLIVATRGYGIEAAAFASFGPVFELEFFTGERPPLEQGRAELLRLGERLGRLDEARRVIAAADEAIASTARRTALLAGQRFCAVSMFEERHLRIYGAGSLITEVTDRLGLANGWDRPTNNWGFSTIGFDQLARVGVARLIVLTPISRAAERMMSDSALWQALPCVRAGTPAMIPTVWPFGGLSAGARFAGLVADALVPA